jgi:hypothetical protein
VRAHPGPSIHPRLWDAPTVSLWQAPPARAYWPPVCALPQHENKLSCRKLVRERVQRKVKAKAARSGRQPMVHR